MCNSFPERLTRPFGRCGKTTLARLLANSTDAVFKELSATSSGVNDIRPIVEEAKNVFSLTRRSLTF